MHNKKSLIVVLITMQSDRWIMKERAEIVAGESVLWFKLLFLKTINCSRHRINLSQQETVNREKV